MYEIAKKARESLKSKAKRIAAGEPGAKVDSSSYEPPKDALNADVKTGLRPVSRRAYKTGGKVQGAKPKANLGVTPRSYANAKINRNVKDANEDREGIKHVGGMKKGGRAKKEHGGGLYEGNKPVVSPTAPRAKPEPKSSAPQNAPLPPRRPADLPKDEGMTPEQAKKFMESRKSGGRAKKAIGGAFGQYLSPVLMLANAVRGDRDDKKKGGRAKKNMGGPMMGADPRLGMVKDKMLEFGGNPVTPGLKKGGKVSHMEWEHSKKDLREDKKLAKKHGMSMESWEKSKLDEKHDKQQSMKGLKKGGAAKRMNRKEGGGVFSGAGYPEKIPGVVPGGRTARKNGGRAKGKTDINIIISTGKKPDDQMMAPPPGAPPPGLPVPVPGGPQGGPPPMPMAAPPAPPPQMPPQMPPMARKRGGRTSYKDMTAGAGSGEGRLQKTEIQANKRSERKAGGKVCRSYKDMDAGSGSGLGRLEKTEIQSRKH